MFNKSTTNLLNKSSSFRSDQIYEEDSGINYFQNILIFLNLKTLIQVRGTGKG
jgi:hypothetical protein